MGNENSKLIKKLKQQMKDQITLYSIENVLKLSVFMGFEVDKNSLRTKKQLNKFKNKIKTVLDGCNVSKLIDIGAFMNVNIPSKILTLLQN